MYWIPWHSSKSVPLENEPQRQKYQPLPKQAQKKEIKEADITEESAGLTKQRSQTIINIEKLLMQINKKQLLRDNVLETIIYKKARCQKQISLERFLSNMGLVIPKGGPCASKRQIREVVMPDRTLIPEVHLEGHSPSK